MKEYTVQIQIKIFARNSSEAEEVARDLLEAAELWMEEDVTYQVLGTVDLE